MSSLATATRQASSSLPYLSHSRVSRYLHCPEQYRLYYVAERVNNFETLW